MWVCMGNVCRPVEVLRKESLAGLAPSAACRVLSHAYAAVVPITPLPYPPLPLSPNTPGQSVQSPMLGSGPANIIALPRLCSIGV